MAQTQNPNSFFPLTTRLNDLDDDGDDGIFGITGSILDSEETRKK